MKYFGVTLCSFHSFVVGNAPPSPLHPSRPCSCSAAAEQTEQRREGPVPPSVCVASSLLPPPSHRLGRHTRVRAPPPLRDREIDFVPPNDIKQAARSRSSARPRSGGVPPTRRPRSFQETEDDGRCPEGARARRPPSSPSLSLLIRRRRPLSPCGQTQSVGDGKGRLMRTRTRSHGWEGGKRTGG